MADSDNIHAGALPADISSSLGSLWKQYSGERPADIQTVIRGTKIACVLKDSVGRFTESVAVAAADEADPDPDMRQLTPSNYRHDAIQAVSRVTHRKVMAFISDHDEKTDVATEVFIIDAPARQPRSIFLDRRPD
jgi:uncharacterized protein YbcI